MDIKEIKAFKIAQGEPGDLIEIALDMSLHKGDSGDPGPDGPQVKKIDQSHFI